jgi:serine/threonine protein kinase
MALVSDLQKEVSYVGLSSTCKTVQEFYSWLKKLPVLFVPEKFQFNKLKNTYFGKHSQFAETIDIIDGNFGTVKLSYLESPTFTGYCFLKQSKKHQTSLIIEGLLQSCAHVALKRYGFPEAIPRVLNIVALPEAGVSLVLQRIPNSRMFAEYLKTNFQWGHSCQDNDDLVLQIIVQVATYMAILEYELSMNHRDLKSTNVLMIAPVDEFKREVVCGPHSWSFRSKLQVSIIDFGFSCVGSHLKDIVLSAGNYLPETDLCPKDGRDLFLFLASLWAIPEFRVSVSAPVQELFENWLVDSKGKNWADWLCVNDKDNLVSMYLLCSSSSFFSVRCQPIFMLMDIHKLAPHLVPFAAYGRPVTPVPPF